MPSPYEFKKGRKSGAKKNSGFLLLFDKIKMARKPGKKSKENPVGYTGKVKR